MSRKRKPEAVYLEEGSVLVKHTHDAELADRLAREEIAEQEHWETDQERINLGDRREVWVRIINALPGSYAELNGWSWEYRWDQPGKRGVFPAMEYLR